MPFDVRLGVIALATFFVAGSATAALVPYLARRTARTAASLRASALFRLRVLPVLVAAIATLQGVVSFVLFEPRSGDETFGIVLVSLALGALALSTVGAVQAGLGALRTRRALRTWMQGAERIAFDDCPLPSFVINSAFPVVAVVGLRRPKLVIARSVLEACSPEELRAILAHERQHAERRDNFRRFVLYALPDLFVALPAGRRLLDMWHDASEAAADEGAAALGPHGRVDLAMALLRVARLAPAGSGTVALPASALYRGEGIAERVRRLLAPVEPCVDRRLAGWRRMAVMTTVITGGVLALHAVHEVVEAAVSTLP